MKSKKFPIIVTNQAIERIKEIISNCADDKIIGLKIGTKKGGCSGTEYDINYAYDLKPIEESLDIEIKNKTYKLILDANSIINLIGSTMDYKQDKLESRFIFINPNAKGYCGCGESFYTA